MAEQKNTLQTYQWESPSLITHVDIRDQTKGGAVAYLYAPDDSGAQCEKLHDLREALQKKGWTVSPDLRGDESVMRVTGIGKKEDLVSVLQDGQFTQGDPATLAPVRDKPKSFVEKIKQHALRASGIVYTFGNALYVVSGIKRKNDIGQIGTGVAFATGDVAVAVFGGKDDERQFKSLMTHLGKELNKKGIAIPKDSAFAAEISTKGESFGEKSYDFMHEHIEKIKAAAEVGGGYFYFKAGGGEQKNIWKQITAVIFSLGFGSSALIKEKKTDPDELKDAGPLKKAWAFWQEAPLRVAGWSGLSNTVLTTVGAFDERRKERIGKKIVEGAWPIDLATAGTMLVANNLYAFSHKSAGGKITNGGLIDDIYGLTAQVINKLPEEKREAAVKTAAGFLGDSIEIPDFRKQAEAKLREHMAHAASENLWFNSAKKQETPEAASPSPALAALAPAKKEENWTDYVARGEQPAASPAI